MEKALIQWENPIAARKQLNVFFILLGLYAISAFLTYAFFADQLAATVGVPMPDMGVSDSVLGLANAGIVLVLYGVLGLAGFWFAIKLGLPGIYSVGGNWRRWFTVPLLLGLVCGVALVAGDVIFASINGFGRILHPGFPASILAFAVDADIDQLAIDFVQTQIAYKL